MIGVYLLLYCDEVVYVGATKNYPKRISQHKDKKFNDHRFISCSYSRLASLEKQMIKQHKPKYNKSKGQKAHAKGRGSVDPAERVILVGFYTKQRIVDHFGGLSKCRQKCKDDLEGFYTEIKRVTAID